VHPVSKHQWLEDRDLPTYLFRNYHTGEPIEITCSMKELASSKPDPAVWYRDWAGEQCSGAPTGDTWPLKSDGAGCSPDQIPEMQKHLASRGVNTEYDKKTGQAIFRSRGHRNSHLKAMGMHDRAGGYGDHTGG